MRERRTPQPVVARCKLVLVGDVHCGKTAMLQVLAKDCYPEVRGKSRAPLRLREGGRVLLRFPAALASALSFASLLVSRGIGPDPHAGYLGGASCHAVYPPARRSTLLRWHHVACSPSLVLPNPSLLQSIAFRLCADFAPLCSLPWSTLRAKGLCCFRGGCGLLPFHVFSLSVFPPFLAIGLSCRAIHRLSLLLLDGNYDFGLCASPAQELTPISVSAHVFPLGAKKAILAKPPSCSNKRTCNINTAEFTR